MKVKKVLWTSRHQLDPVAEDALRNWYGDIQLEAGEILWPSDWHECRKMATDLLEKYDVVAGVFPSQATEAFTTAFVVDPVSVGTGRVISPVSVPVTEPDERKVRAFRFVRWAIIV